MKIAVISDVHSNLSALEAVLDKISGLKVERICCLGDIVGYGPFPNECVELIRERCSLIVKGNHDSGAIGETDLDHFNAYGKAAIQWTREVLAPANLDFLRELPLIWIEEQVTYVHASPADPHLWTYVVNLQDAVNAFNALTTTTGFVGHTHLPFVLAEDLATTSTLKKGMRHLINVGSVGQPRDRNPESAFGVFDTSELRFDLHRVPYNIRETSKAIKKAGLPGFLASRLRRGV